MQNVVKQPFTQLFSIHSFIRKDGKTKQVPLMFVLMSGKRKSDYKNVLPADIQLMKLVADFKAAVWDASLQVFPHLRIQGCLFHFCQALRKKIDELGLLRAYNQREALYCFVKKIMALPFLPHEQISGAFYELKALATDDVVKQFMGYVERQWIVSEFFQPRRWCIFKEDVRTNSIEGLITMPKEGNCSFICL